MKYLIIIAVASIASADKLDKVYLPPGARGSSGGSAGLETPVGPLQQQSYSGQQQAFSSSSASASATAEIIKYENEMNEQGYRYAYETSDGTKAEQEGRVIPGAVPEEGSLAVTGSFSYVGDDGQTYSIRYTADENGFRPEGAHLPTSPPIPEPILKSLELTDTSREHYNSGKSSYDADAGY